jgi:hypothetical protein
MNPIARLIPPPYTETEIQREPLYDPQSASRRFAMRQANIDHWTKWTQRFMFATIFFVVMFVVFSLLAWLSS